MIAAPSVCRELNDHATVKDVGKNQDPNDPLTPISTGGMRRPRHHSRWKPSGRSCSPRTTTSRAISDHMGRATGVVSLNIVRGPRLRLGYLAGRPDPRSNAAWPSQRFLSGSTSASSLPT